MGERGDAFRLLVCAMLLRKTGRFQIGRVDAGLQRALPDGLVTRWAGTCGRAGNRRAGERVSGPTGKLLLPGRVATIVYTDGACSRNPGPGGWAWAVRRGRYVSGAAARTTNQRMEITAVLEAVRALDGTLEVVSDSTHVINCFRDRWWKGWLQNNWSNRRRKPVANRDLWEPLIEIVQHRDIRFCWVRGHSGDPMNDLVDQLAVTACRTQQGQQGNVLDAGIAITDDV